MNRFKFNQNMELNMIPYADIMNYSYHINSFEFPTRHSHEDYWEFTIVLDGTFNNYCERKKTAYPFGSVLVATTKHSHFILNASNEPLRYMNLIVKEEHALKVLDLVAPKLLKDILQGKSQFFLKRRIISEIESTLLNVQPWNPNSLDRNEELINSAFLLLLSSLSLSSESPLTKPGKWIENLNRIIRENDYLKLTTNDLCELLGYSRPTLTSLFKKYFYMTPHEYLMNLKFEHASYLLLNSDCTISEISERLGYANPAAFYRAFRKVYGVTPHEYKKQMEASTKEF